MKRVLQIGMYGNLGGIDSFLMNYYRNMRKTNIQFDFINMYPEFVYRSEIISLGGKVYDVPYVKKHPIRYYCKLIRIIKDNNYQIVHVHMLSAANIIPLIVAKKCKVEQIISHVHCNNIIGSRLKKLLNSINKKFVISLANTYCACSKSAGDWFYGTKKKYIVIPNAIDYEKFLFNSKKREKIRKELNINNKFVIGHVGRINEVKNQMFVLDIFQSMLNYKNNIILLLIGTGELEDKIKYEIKKRNLNDKVVLLSPMKNVYDYYQAMDSFIFPSKYEGFGMALVEAQISGLPCYASDKVPVETKILNSTVYMSLDNPPIKWAQIILKSSKPTTRKLSKCDVANNQMNIKYQVDKLIALYGDR